MQECDYRQVIREKTTKIWMRYWGRDARNNTKSWKKWKSTIKASIEYRVFHECYQDTYIHVLEKFVGRLNNKAILNVGCGAGGFEVAVHKHISQIVGCDIDKGFVDIARIRSLGFAENRPILLTCDGRKLPFRKQTFDIVTCFDVLEHVSQRDKLITEIIRVLKPNGFLFMTVGPNKWFPYDTHYRLFFINWLPKNLAIKCTRFFRPEFARMQSTPVEYVTPPQIIKLLKPYMRRIKRVWPSIIEHSFKCKRAPPRLPDLFLSGASMTARRFHLGSAMIVLSKILSFLSMEMTVCLLGQKT